MMIKEGQKAPLWSLPNQEGKIRSLEEHRGQIVILYFYPKDNTPGCTIESIDFSQKKESFQEKDAVIYGISKDSVASHQRFVSKKSLTIDLLSDEEGTMCEDYGVWQEKKTFGKTYMGLVRSTFLIDKEGTLVKIWSPVKVKGHVDAVYQEVCDRC